MPKYSRTTHVPGDRVRRTSSRALSRTFAMQLWQRNTRRNAALQRAPRQRVRVCLCPRSVHRWCVRVSVCVFASVRARAGVRNISRMRRAPQMRPQFHRGKTRCPFTIQGTRVSIRNADRPRRRRATWISPPRENIENTWNIENNLEKGEA